MHVAVIGVEGYEPGRYAFTRDSERLSRLGEIDKRLLVELAQGQHWILSGGGGVFFFGVNWPELRLISASADLAYLELLRDIGYVGGRVLNRLTESGLGAWMTPALDEAKAARAFELPDGDDLLYLMKFGVSKPAPLGPSDPPESLDYGPR